VSSLSEVASFIRDAQAQLAEADRLIAANGPSPSMLMAADAIRSQVEELHQRFMSLSKAQAVNVCSYRLISEHTGRYPVSSVGRVLADFQSVLSVLYDCIKNQVPRQRAKHNIDIARETGLDFAYSFDGSLGFMLTMSPTQLEIAESTVDVAVRTLFELAHASDSTAVSVFAKTFGVAPVRGAFRWANDHAESDLSAAIEWRSGSSEGQQFFVSAEQLQRFTKAVSETSEQVSEPMELYGRLVGADVATREFHFIVDKQDIRGDMDDGFQFPSSFNLGQFYLAKLVRQRRIYFATEKEDTSYILKALDERALTQLP
jgi:hypothetical protein